MQELDDMALLREYAARNSEAAFETLVSRRVNFVYSAAMRQTRDPHRAEEITQAVFIILAQKAGKISDKTILTGWLFKTTRFAALAQARAAIKRKQREQEAHMQSEIQPTTTDALWEQMSPLLDEALAQLGEKDRQAVLLRFFENKNFAEMGSRLGTGEDTARKRVNRALEKLRNYFSRRGVVSTTAIIAGVVSANSVQAAPAGLVISVGAFAKGAAVSGSTLTLIKGASKVMAWTKAKIIVVAAVGLLAAVGTTTVAVKTMKPRQASDSWRVRMFDSRVLDNAEPQVRILPAKFPQGGGYGSSGEAWMGIGAPVTAILSTAYHQSPARTIFPADLPGEKYDFIAKLPKAPRPQDVFAALQQEVKKEFGLTGRLEMRETDVLVLTTNTVHVEKLLPSKARRGESSGLSHPGEFVAVNQPVHTLAGFLESYFQVPVIDRTGLTGKFDIDLKWYEPEWRRKNPQGLKQALINQLGLELVPSREPINMLVVEKVK